MSFRSFTITISTALILSAVAWLINLPGFFPAPVAYFIMGLLTACIAISIPGGKKGKGRKKHKPRKPSSLLNDGQMETGNVKWFSTSKGFGFITRENGEDIFVHFRSIAGKGHRALREGQRVEFAVSEGSKGLQAEEVNIIS